MAHFEKNSIICNTLRSSSVSTQLLVAGRYAYEPWKSILGANCVNVSDYVYSKVDNSDDSVELQRAIDAAYGKVLFFPAGTYIVKQKLFIRDHIHIVADPDAIILSDTNDFTIAITPDLTLPENATISVPFCDEPTMPTNYVKYLKLGDTTTTLAANTSVLNSINAILPEIDNWLLYVKHSQPSIEDYGYDTTYLTGQTISRWKVDAPAWNIQSGKGGKGILLEIPTETTIESTLVSNEQYPFAVKIPLKYAPFSNFCPVTNPTGASYKGDPALSVPDTNWDGTFAPTASFIKVIKDIVVDGLTIRSLTEAGWLNGTNKGISVSQTKNVTIKNCKFEKVGNTGLLIEKSVKTYVEKCSFDDIPQVGNAYGYGIVVGESGQTCFIRNNYFSKCRHGVTFGGPYGANHCFVENNYFTQPRQTNHTHIDVHEQSSNIYVKNNYFDGFANGIHFRSSFCVADGNHLVQNRVAIKLEGLGFSNEDGVINTIICNNVIENPYVAGIQAFAKNITGSYISLKQTQIVNNFIYRNYEHDYAFHEGISIGVEGSTNDILLDPGNNSFSDVFAVVRDTIVSGNTLSYPHNINLYNQPQYALSAKTVQKLVITNNTFTVTSASIRVSTLTTTVIANNTFHVDTQTSVTGTYVPTQILVRYPAIAVNVCNNNFITNLTSGEGTGASAEPLILITEAQNIVRDPIINVSTNQVISWFNVFVRLQLTSDGDTVASDRVVVRNNIALQTNLTASQMIQCTNVNNSSESFSYNNGHGGSDTNIAMLISV